MSDLKVVVVPVGRVDVKEIAAAVARVSKVLNAPVELREAAGHVGVNEGGALALTLAQPPALVGRPVLGKQPGPSGARLFFTQGAPQGLQD